MLFWITIVLTILVIFLSTAGWFLLSDRNSDKTDFVRKLIESRGHRLQVHKVITEDGHILTLHRVVTIDHIDDPLNPKRPILIAHGLYCSSIDFLYTSSDINKSGTESIIFQLLERSNYDVWMMNNRGNAFSTEHINLNRSDHEYWNFSCDHLSKYDLSSTIDYVRKHTKRESIGFIGFSQGNLLMFALLAERPEYGRMIRPMIAWAPAAFFGHMDSPIRYAVPLLTIFRMIGGQFILFRITNWLGYMFRPTPIVQWITATIFRMVMGATDRSRHTDLPIWLHMFPSSGSSWQLVQHLQWVRSQCFTKFDYGSQRINQIHYGTDQPPQYDLERIDPETIIILMRATTDTMTTKRDIDRLGTLLKRKLKIFHDVHISTDTFNHLDFIMNVDAAQLVYDDTIRYLNRYIQ
ncbi:hypothetical protein RDWZM_010154 [Blomia tropicalis]|uniref:Lipase n=1 Tax=Blomia tropicalis TaxID=40697 RepID=A0A9Q0LY77_BLOTA|nr:Alpha/beta-hydrolase lipase region [Blomia tropicalis]KAJ6215654.1 hypothetical protein RDWZM_010154 [Blomia tropicalis]